MAEITTKVLPLFSFKDMKVYPEQVTAAVQCNKCGDLFMVTLRGQTKMVSTKTTYKRLIETAYEKHICEIEALPAKDRKANASECDQIVNGYHETKRKLIGNA